jgi:hypothetical protein
LSFPTDLGTWGFILAALSLVLMYPVGLLINLTTPAVQNWVASRSKTSLLKRITLLENELSELEKNAAISEAEDQILWEIQNTKSMVIAMASGVTFVIYLGVAAIADRLNPSFRTFSEIVLVVVFLNLPLQLMLRYKHDFRHERSPRRREALRNSIQELKRIRDSWGQ